MARRTLAVALLGLAGCDDVLWGQVADVETLDGYAGVKQIAELNCNGCHGATAAFGTLDLETDLYGALVDVPSSTDSNLILVVPGDPENSFVFQKIEGTNPVGTGTPMPPTVQLDTELIGVWRGWIEDGAPAE